METLCGSHVTVMPGGSPPPPPLRAFWVGTQSVSAARMPSRTMPNWWRTRTSSGESGRPPAEVRDRVADEVLERVLDPLPVLLRRRAEVARLADTDPLDVELVGQADGLPDGAPAPRGAGGGGAAG